MATEVDRLVVVFDANFKALDDKLNKVIRSNYAAAKKVEDAWSGSNSPFYKAGEAAGALVGQLPGVGAAVGALAGPAAAATAGVVALTAAFGQAIQAVEYADALGDTAKRLHVTTDELQEYRYAIRLAGGETAGADEALEKFSETLGKAQQGLAKPLRAFKALGLDPNDFKTAKEGIIAVTRAMEGLSDAQRDAIIAQFGLGGLKELIGDGADEMTRLLGEAKKVGVVMDADLIARAGELNDQFETAKEVIGVQLKSAFVDLMPVIVSILGLMARFAQLAGKISDSFRDVEKRTTAGLERNVEELSARIERRALDAQKRTGGRMEPSMEAAQRRDLELLSKVNSELADRRAEAAAAEAAALKTTKELIPATKAAARARKAAAKKPERLTAVEPIFAEGVDPMELGDNGEIWKQIHGLRELEKRAREREAEPLKPMQPEGDLITPEDWQREWADAMRRAEEDVRNGVYDGIRGGLEAGFRDGLPGVLRYLRDALFRNVLDSVAAGLTSALTRGGGTGGVAGFFASLFGRRGYAAGTTSSRRGWSVVGERGPELVNLPAGSRVLSNANLRNVALDSGAGRATQTIVFDNRGAVIWEQAARQMMSYADRAASVAGIGAVNASRAATPQDLARKGGRRLGR